MRRLAGVAICGALVWTGVAQAQFGRGSGWATDGNDAQRSGWVRTDPKISADALAKPGFEMVWKVKVAGDAKQGMAAPDLLDRYIGYRGFRALGYVAAGDNITAIDTDLARIEWKKRLATAAPAPSGCPASNASLALPISAAFPMMAGGRAFGRGGPARSAVGNPGEGAVTLREAPTPRSSFAPPRTGGAVPVFVRSAIVMHALSSDGMLHTMYVSNGEEPDAAVKFLPPGANVRGLIVVDKVAYAATAQGCGGAPDAVWALDLASGQVASWKPASGGIAGSDGVAFGPEGALYVATTGGEVVELEPKTLKLKESYRAEQAFITSPVIIEYKEKALVAAASKDGRIHLLDAKALAGSKHRSEPSSISGTLASWQDSVGGRWLLASSGGAVVSWKLVEQDGAFTFQKGWVSRDIAAPLTPMIMNGVVFTAAAGAPAVMYALDGLTGKELWNSGKTLAGTAHGAGISGGTSQVYLGTSDGTLYAFGYPIEH